MAMAMAGWAASAMFALSIWLYHAPSIKRRTVKNEL